MPRDLLHIDVKTYPRFAVVFLPLAATEYPLPSTRNNTMPGGGPCCDTWTTAPPTADGTAYSLREVAVFRFT